MTTRATKRADVECKMRNPNKNRDVRGVPLGWAGAVAAALVCLLGISSATPSAHAEEKSGKKRDVSEVPAGGGAGTAPSDAAPINKAGVKPTKRAVSKSPLDPYRDFGLTGEYKLYLNRTLQDKAEVYHSPPARSWLVLNTNYPGGKALLLDSRSRKIFTLPGDNFLKASNVLDTLAIRSDSTLKELGEIRFQAKKGTMGKSMGWSYEDKKAGISLRLRPSGDFKGTAGIDGLLRIAPQYRRDTAAYKKMVNGSKEESAWLADLKKLVAKHNARTMTVEVYFGTWCPTCKQVIGKIMFLDRELPGIRFSYYGFSSIKEEYEKNDKWVKNKILKLPTVVIRKNGKEIGRAHSNHWDRPVITMLTELQKYDRSLKADKSNKKPAKWK